MNPILVQLRDSQWTVEAMHLASAIAHDQATTVTLLRLIEVQHVNWLGTELGIQPPSISERELIRTCRAIAQEYGVSFNTFDFQYVTLSDALVQAAAQVNAQAVFAALPASTIPVWRKFQNWHMSKQFATLECDFFNLEVIPTVGNSPPAILVHSRKKIASTI